MKFYNFLFFLLAGVLIGCTKQKVITYASPEVVLQTVAGMGVPLIILKTSSYEGIPVLRVDLPYNENDAKILRDRIIDGIEHSQITETARLYFVRQNTDGSFKEEMRVDTIYVSAPHTISQHTTVKKEQQMMPK